MLNRANKQHVEHSKGLFPNEIMLLDLKSLSQFYSGSHLNSKYIKVRRYIFQKILVNGNYFLKSIPWTEAYEIREFKYNILQHSPTQIQQNRENATHTQRGQEHGRDGVTCAALLVRHPLLILYNNVVCKGAYTVSSQKSSTGQEREHMSG
jgi:hypothetical protein